MKVIVTGNSIGQTVLMDGHTGYYTRQDSSSYQIMTEQAGGDGCVICHVPFERVSDNGYTVPEPKSRKRAKEIADRVSGLIADYLARDTYHPLFIAKELEFATRQVDRENEK